VLRSALTEADGGAEDESLLGGVEAGAMPEAAAQPPGPLSAAGALPGGFTLRARPAPASGQGPVPAVVRDGRKVGRNEPCPCGSGKKYKHCHGALASGA